MMRLRKLRVPNIQEETQRFGKPSGSRSNFTRSELQGASQRGIVVRVRGCSDTRRAAWICASLNPPEEQGLPGPTW